MSDLVERLRAVGYMQPTPNIEEEAADEIERLRAVAIKNGAMDEAPCQVCGYDGPGFFQPESHHCAAIYHKNKAR